MVYLATVDLSIRFLLLDQLVHLRQVGCEVQAACAAGPWVDDIRAAGIELYHVPLRREISPLADLVALVRLVRLFRRLRPDIVHTHTPKANLVGRLAARLTRVPLVAATEHGFYFYGMTGAARWFWVMLARLGAAWSDVVFLYNREDVETACREGIVRPDRTVYVPGGLGVDLARFAPDQDPAAARRALGLPREAPTVGIVGRLTWEKGYREFLRAAAQVRQAVPDCRFLAVGPADRQEDRDFRSFVMSLGLDDVVTFTGMRTDMPQVYAAMDVMCLPSYREGLPVVLMEAAAMGLPTVATDIRGCRDVVVDGVTGLLVPPRDHQAVAEALIRLLTDPARARAMGAAARKRAEEVFDQRLVFAQVEGEYQRRLAAKGKPWPGR